MRAIDAPLLVRSALFVGLLTITVDAALAQGIDATIIEDPAGEPVPGAMVSLINPDAVLVSRALTDSLGKVRLAAPHGGTWHLLVERIGYRTVESAAFELADSGYRAVTLRVPLEPIVVSEIRVEAEPVCRLGRAGMQTATVLWEETRKALERVLWTRAQREYRFEVTLYDRELDREMKTVRQETRETLVANFKPFRTAPAEDLIRAGFIQVVEEDTLYFGPDAAILLSDPFARTHCFHSVRSEETGRPGLAFSPVDAGASDIAGVLWLNEDTGALEDLEFHYTGPIAAAVDRPHEGQIAFRGLPDGNWIVEQWWIRLPLYSRPLVWRGKGMATASARRELRFKGYTEKGGIVYAVGPGP